MGDWITPLAERALTCYLSSGVQDSTTDSTDVGLLNLEDDGSNLRFRDSIPRRAQIFKVR